MANYKGLHNFVVSQSSILGGRVYLVDKEHSPAGCYNGNVLLSQLNQVTGEICFTVPAHVIPTHTEEKDGKKVTIPEKQVKEKAAFWLLLPVHKGVLHDLNDNIHSCECFETWEEAKRRNDILYPAKKADKAGIDKVIAGVNIEENIDSITTMTVEELKAHLLANGGEL